MSSLRPQGLASSLKRPIVFVTGKGGVGKTTVAAALAVLSAESGVRSAYVEMDDAEAGKRALQGADAPVDHVVAQYDVALEETIAPLLGGALVARTFLRNGPVKRLTRAIPSLREFVSLEKVRALAASGKYGRIVVDLPASGHAIDWLRVPRAFERFLAGGPLGSLGRRVHDEVVVPEKSQIVIVTLAEMMVVRETAELANKTLDELGRRPSHVVVNRVTPGDPAGSLEAATRLVEASLNDDDAAAFAALLRARSAASRDAMEALQQARGLEGVQVLAVPETPIDPNVNQVARWLEAPPL